MNPLDSGLALLSLPVLAGAVYLAGLALVARRLPGLVAGERLRFALVVPAHDEEAGVGATVGNLLALDWPAANRRVVVVADNCSDRTAARAAAAGARVLVRDDPGRRGKGHALAHAFRAVLEEGWADAVVVVDADSLVTPNLLRAFEGRLRAGARAVQADYRVRNPEASWRTRLMVLALATFHRLRGLARERLSLSCGLAGNGMCFDAGLLREVPHQAVSVVEDLEYGIRLGEAGHRVWYADEAAVLGEMAATSATAASQRLRWEGGRRSLARREGWGLLRRALVRGDRVLLDLSVDLLLPPLSRLAGLSVLGTAVAALLQARGPGAPFSLCAWGASLCLLGVYLFRGWRLSGTGPRGAALLLAAPAYLAWKAALALRRRPRGREEWVRTTREGEAGT